MSDAEMVSSSEEGDITSSSEEAISGEDAEGTKLVEIDLRRREDRPGRGRQVEGTKPRINSYFAAIYLAGAFSAGYNWMEPSELDAFVDYASESYNQFLKKCGLSKTYVEMQEGSYFPRLLNFPDRQPRRVYINRKRQANKPDELLDYVHSDLIATGFSAVVHAGGSIVCYVYSPWTGYGFFEPEYYKFGVGSSPVTLWVTSDKESDLWQGLVSTVNALVYRLTFKAVSEQDESVIPPVFAETSELIRTVNTDEDYYADEPYEGETTNLFPQSTLNYVAQLFTNYEYKTAQIKDRVLQRENDLFETDAEQESFVEYASAVEIDAPHMVLLDGVISTQTLEICVPDKDTVKPYDSKYSEAVRLLAKDLLAATKLPGSVIIFGNFYDLLKSYADKVYPALGELLQRLHTLSGVIVAEKNLMVQLSPEYVNWRAKLREDNVEYWAVCFIIAISDYLLRTISSEVNVSVSIYRFVFLPRTLTYYFAAGDVNYCVFTFDSRGGGIIATPGPRRITELDNSIGVIVTPDYGDKVIRLVCTKPNPSESFKLLMERVPKGHDRFYDFLEWIKRLDQTPPWMKANVKLGVYVKTALPIKNTESAEKVDALIVALAQIIFPVDGLMIDYGFRPRFVEPNLESSRDLFLDNYIALWAERKTLFKKTAILESRREAMPYSFKILLRVLFSESSMADKVEKNLGPDFRFDRLPSSIGPVTSKIGVVRLPGEPNVSVYTKPGGKFIIKKRLGYFPNTYHLAYMANMFVSKAKELLARLSEDDCNRYLRTETAKEYKITPVSDRTIPDIIDVLAADIVAVRRNLRDMEHTG